MDYIDYPPLPPGIARFDESQQRPWHPLMESKTDITVREAEEHPPTDPYLQVVGYRFSPADGIGVLTLRSWMFRCGRCGAPVEVAPPADGEGAPRSWRTCPHCGMKALLFREEPG